MAAPERFAKRQIPLAPRAPAGSLQRSSDEAGHARSPVSGDQDFLSST
jgi:hypothetical protein